MTSWDNATVTLFAYVIVIYFVVLLSLLLGMIVSHFV
jgi:hypothetical protein